MLPHVITIPDISLIVLEAFDKVVGPLLIDPNPNHRAIRLVITRQILSTALDQISSHLSSHLAQISIEDVVIIAITALNLSGIAI